MKNALTWSALALMVVVPVLVVWFLGSAGSSLNKPVNTAGLLDDSQNQVELIFFRFRGM